MSEFLGITHADIGYELAKKWDLPSTISTCIAFHHNPSIAMVHKRFVSLAHVSDIWTRRMHIGSGGDDQQLETEEYAKRIARTMPSVEEKREEIVAQVDSIIPSDDSDSKK